MKNITIDENGKYVWEYEIDLNQNKVIFDLIMKILTGIFAFIVIVMTVVIAIDGSLDWEGLWFFLKIALPIFLFVYVLGFLSYRLYARSLGGFYHVRFEMDEEGISHIPMKREQEYSKNIGILSMLIGLFTRNVGQVGTGMYIATLENIYSRFSKVSSVKTDRKHDLINVNYMTLNNQIYVDKEDYDFVLDYIVSRCTKARIVDK